MTDESAALTPDDVRGMSYNQIIGLTRETNRIPGGTPTVARIARMSFLTEQSEVLEIGTSTGSTALELARSVRGRVVGIDLNPASLAEARSRADRLRLTNARFEQADACRLPFPAEQFDLVVVGNVFSLVSDRGAALAECCRVARYERFLAAVPMYYLRTPPERVVERVRRAIQVHIPVAFRADAVAGFDHPELELYGAEDYQFDEIPEDRVRRFVADILRRPHLEALRPDARSALGESYLEHMLLFRENLAHMGYTILVFRRTRFREDPILFTAAPRADSGGARA